MKTYSGDYAQDIAFPLSGIGTGGISISGIGELIDWELDGRANKESRNEYSHFAIKAERNGTVLDARVLHGDKTIGLQGTELAAHHHSWGYGQGPNRTTLAGIAHFPDVEFTGAFPFADMVFSCDTMRADIRLRAFNPFIPNDEDNSSLPAAFFSWKITNTADQKTEYTLAFSVGNPFRIRDGGYSRFEKDGGLSSITLKSRNRTPEQQDYCELSVMTDCPDISYQEYWFRSGWFDDVTTYWREFSSPGKLRNRHYDNDDPHGQLDIGDTCTLAAHITLEAGETREVRFLLAWYYPHFVKYWDEKKPIWKHEYVRRFASVKDIGAYCFDRYQILYEKSMRFSKALAEMTLPESAADAVSSNLCVLKSPTCLRLENGEFWAFEGTNGHSGSCEGTCDHVWNYQYALAYLFPRFARQILETDYTYNLKPSGEMMFRTMLPLGSTKWNFRACVDGQMGSILRFYREWKLSGDDEWLKKWWPCVKKTLEYAWNAENYDLWDPEKTGVISGRQHHTLDVELFGPNAWLTGFYLAALKACAEIAEYLGENDAALEYRKIFRNGQQRMEKELFNGKHYIQKIDITDRSQLDKYAQHDPDVYYYWNDETKEIKYQIQDGCGIDQMLSQWHATLIGLGDIFDPSHRKTAARSLFKINFRSMRDVFNPCRVFAANAEAGLLICNWSCDKKKPSIPIPYTEECMTGFEYAAAGLMIQEGLLSEGISVIDAVRDRYDGKKRNPYSELECGASYARSMASFALPAVFSGYTCDMTKKEIGFSPVIKGKPHTTVWFAGGAWGMAEIGESSVKLCVSDGSVAINIFCLPADEFAPGITSVQADGKEVPFNRIGKRICITNGIVVNRTLLIQ